MTASRVGEKFGRRRLGLHAAALTLILGILASEGLLAAARSGARWAADPSSCAWIAGPRAVPALLKIIENPAISRWNEEAAARELLRVGDVADARLMVAVLASGDQDAAEEATRHLVSLGPAAVPALIEALGRPETTVVESVNRVLVRLGETAVPGLAHAARSGERSVETRRRAIEALGAIRDYQAIGHLSVVVTETSSPPEVAISAARALARTRGPIAAASLSAVVGDPGRSGELREAAVLALGELGEESALPTLLAALRDPRCGVPVREAAGWAMGRMRGPDSSPFVIPALMTALRDPEPRVRNGAAMGLSEIGAPAVPALLAGLRQRLRSRGRDLDDGDWMAWALGRMRLRRDREARAVLAAADRRSHYRGLKCVFCTALRATGAR